MITRLRILTEKSKIGFGSYANNTVGELLHLGKRQVLSWYYYNCSNITFTDEVLDKIGIYRHRIEKPGKAPEHHCILCVGKNSIAFMKRKSNTEKEKKIARKLIAKGRENIWHSKAANAWKNQGH